jgi:cell division protein FtsA
MKKERLIAGLDIGSSHIRLVVGQPNYQENKIYITSAVEILSNGVSKGSVVSIEDAVSSVSHILDQTERIIGEKIESLYVAVSGTHITSMISKGTIATSRPKGEISEDDIERAIGAAQTVATPPNCEILHVIPKSFTVDNQQGIKDPIGMSGIRLEVDTQIIQGQSSHVNNITKAISRAGVEIDSLVFGILAGAECVLDKKQKELGVALVNIGYATTSIAVFEEGDILSVSVLPIGSVHITNDIAIGLKSSLDVAEAVKLEYGNANINEYNRKDEIDLSEIDEKETGKVSLHKVSEIINARFQEIFEMVDKKLVEIDKSGLLPAGIVLTGSGAKLPGIIEVAKEEFRLPVHIGETKGVETVIEKVKDLSFSTALGLVMWGWQLEKEAPVSGGRFPKKTGQIVNIGVGKIKEFFKKFF